MLINRLNHPLFHDTAWVWTVNTNLSFEPIIKYLFGCKGTNFSTKFQIFSAFFHKAHVTEGTVPIVRQITPGQEWCEVRKNREKIGETFCSLDYFL